MLTLSLSLPLPEHYSRVLTADEMKSTFEQLATTFDSAEPDLEQAKNLLIRLKYLENVEGVCREWTPGKRVELQH